MQLNPDATSALIDRTGYASRAAFARAVGVSQGALHDVLVRDAFTGATRKGASDALIVRIARELKVPVTAIILDPVQAA